MDGCFVAEKGYDYLYYWIVSTVAADDQAPLFGTKASATIMMASALVTVVCTSKSIDPNIPRARCDMYIHTYKTSSVSCVISGVWTICGLANGIIRPPW